MIGMAEFELLDLFVPNEARLPNCVIFIFSYCYRLCTL